MVKVRTIGMLDIAKINPVLKSDKDVANYSFIKDGNDTYLVANTITGDGAYQEDVVIPAGEYLNGHNVEAWKGQELIVDGKHVTGGVSTLEKDAVLVVADDGTLTTGEASGVHFVVTEKTRLTEAAVVVKVAVA